MPERCEASDVDRPLCGQDGVTYRSRCEANRARTDLVAYSYDAACTLDDDTYFKCGGLACVRGTEYCTLSEPLDDSDVERFGCVASPCAVSGGCDCALSELFLEDHDELSCVETEPGVIIVSGPSL
jgi:hypothetical protein